jgi:hypothetical protein
MNQDKTLFRELTHGEKDEFKKSARCEYLSGDEVNDLWHPVYQRECHVINTENALTEMEYHAERMRHFKAQYYGFQSKLHEFEVKQGLLNAD